MGRWDAQPQGGEYEGDLSSAHARPPMPPPGWVFNRYLSSSMRTAPNSLSGSVAFSQASPAAPIQFTCSTNPIMSDVQWIAILPQGAISQSIGSAAPIAASEGRHAG